MNRNRSTRTWPAMVVLGLAVMAGSLAASTRIGADFTTYSLTYQFAWFDK